MIISSRTPEGDPQRCPVCGRTAQLERSDPGGDLICPSCGSLFWHFRSAIVRKTGRSLDAVRLSTLLRDLDSLDLVELIMELEEEYDIAIPDDIAGRMQTIEDAIRYFIARIREGQE